MKSPTHATESYAMLDYLFQLVEWHPGQIYLDKTAIYRFMLCDKVINVVGYANQNQCGVHTEIGQGFYGIGEQGIYVRILYSVKFVNYDYQLP